MAEHKLVPFICPVCKQFREEPLAPEACYDCRAASLRDDSPQRGCSVDGCQRETHYGKPWCTKHIGESPHVKWLLEQLAD